jgi:hypothetical protein
LAGGAPCAVIADERLRLKSSTDTTSREKKTTLRTNSLKDNERELLQYKGGQAVNTITVKIKVMVKAGSYKRRCLFAVVLKTIRVTENCVGMVADKFSIISTMPANG